jgi:hypothetical protein
MDVWLQQAFSLSFIVPDHATLQMFFEAYTFRKQALDL